MEQNETIVDLGKLFKQKDKDKKDQKKVLKFAERFNVLEEIKKIAKTKEFFTTDAILEAFDKDPSMVKPKNWQSLGGFMGVAISKNLITPTGVYKKSTWKQCHGRPKLVYQSKIYRG